MKKLLVILLVLGLAVPAGADLVKFYGSVRTHLGYYDVDEDFGATSGPAMDSSIRNSLGDGDTGTLLTIGGQSRVGFVAKATDALSGVIEFGYRNDDSPYLRLAYGTWNFGAGKLILGQNYTPATFLGYSGMIGDLGDNGDANMLVAGLAYIGRQPQIRLSIGGFDVALIEPNQAAPSLGAMTDVDFTIPRIEAAYTFRTPVFSIRPVLGFQTYEVENLTDSEDITSFLAGIGATVKLGPAYIKATVSYLINPGNYGQSQVVAPAVRFAALDANGDVEDATMLQGTFVVGAKFNQAFGVEAGVGYGKGEIDINDAEQQGLVYYIQFPIMVAQGVSITPEIGYLDRDKLENTALPGGEVELGNMTYVDVNFRVDF